MPRKTKTPQLPLAEERTQEVKDFAEGYEALLRVLYRTPWDGMTQASILADADAFEADLEALPEAKKVAYAAALEDARRYLDYARRAAARNDIAGAWEWMGSVVRTRRFIRGEVRQEEA